MISLFVRAKTSKVVKLDQIICYDSSFPQFPKETLTDDLFFSEAKDIVNNFNRNRCFTLLQGCHLAFFNNKSANLFKNIAQKWNVWTFGHFCALFKVGENSIGYDLSLKNLNFTKNVINLFQLVF